MNEHIRPVLACRLLRLRHRKGKATMLRLLHRCGSKHLHISLRAQEEVHLLEGVGMSIVSASLSLTVLSLSLAVAVAMAQYAGA